MASSMGWASLCTAGAACLPLPTLKSGSVKGQGGRKASEELLVEPSLVSQLSLV